MTSNLTYSTNRFLRVIVFLYLYLSSAAGHLHAADYYWVGGSGNWSDYANHWATGSGGVIFHTTLPGPTDNVYFDANSFTADSQYVYIDSTFAFCYNMDWTGILFAVHVFSQGYPNSKINIFGSLALNPNIIHFRTGINFSGNDSGLVINTQQVVIESKISFNGQGSWKLMSDISAGGINFESGTFYSDGYKMHITGAIYAYSTMNPFVNITGSEVYCRDLQINGNLNFNGSQSRIVIGYSSLTYDCSLICNEGTFGTIIFESPRGQIRGKITADTVIFLNEGWVSDEPARPSSLNCNYLKIDGPGRLHTNNSLTSNIGYAEFFSFVEYKGDNRFDTLVWDNPGSNVKLYGTVTINDTMIVNNNCSSIITIMGSGSLVKSTGTIEMEYVRIGSIHASGGATFIANNSFDLGNNTGWQINGPSARTLYWVNGGGNWSDFNHWSLISGGTGGECPPNQFDNVYFDSQSFMVANDTVFLDRESVYINDFNFTGVVGNPYFHHPLELYVIYHVYGSFIADADGEFNFPFQLSGSNVNNIFHNGPLSLNIIIDGPGTWSLTGDINNVTFNLRNGYLNTNNFNVSNSHFNVQSGVSGTRMIDFGSSTMFNTRASFRYANLTDLITQNSNWIFDSGFNTPIYFNNTTLNDITFYGNGYIDGSFTCSYLTIDSTHTLIGDNITVQRIELGGSGLMEGIFHIDTLLQSSTDAVMTLGDSTVLNVAGFIEMDGVSCDKRTTLQSNTSAFIMKLSGSVNFDYINLRNINCSGGATFNATNAIDLGGNSGWNITSPVARTLYWVGGTGNWSDPNHWSLSSGGSGGNCIPNAYDDVIIDTNSFVLPIYETIYIDHTNIYFNNFYFSSPNINDFVNIDDNDFINIYGSLLFSTKAYFGGTSTSKRANFILNGTASNNFIQSSGTDLERLIMNASGTYSLGDSLTCEKITFKNGIFNSNNFPINTKSIRVDSSAQAINFGNSILSTDTLDVRYANQGFDASNALVKFTAPLSDNNYMYTSGQTFGYIEAITRLYIQGVMRVKEAHFYYDLVCYSTYLDSLYISKGVIYRNFDFNNLGSLIFDTLILNNNGYTIQIWSGSTLIINDTIEVNNSPSFPIQLLSYNNGTFNLEKPSGLVCMDNMIMRGVHAVGSGIFYAGANTIDLGNNTGWIYASCNPNNSDVWPGDANYDLTVDNFDVLYLGLAHGQSGPARTGGSNAWVAQPASDWLYQFANGANLKNADCNGNGVVNDDDTTAISLNYGQTHPLRVQPPSVTALPSIPLFLIASPDTVIQGDTVQIEVHLGTPASPVDSIYGIAFTINFDSTLIDTTFMVFDYSNSWMGVQGSNLLNFEKQFLSQGKVDVAITRTDYMNAAGDGVIVTTGVVVIDNIGARLTTAPPYINLPITLSNPRALTAAEYYLAISLSNDSVEIDTSQTVGLPDINQVSDGINIFPNPAGEYLFAHSARSQITGIEIFDMMGSTTSFDLASSMHQRLDVSGLANGVYRIKIITPAGIIKRKLVVKH